MTRTKLHRHAQRVGTFHPALATTPPFDPQQTYRALKARACSYAESVGGDSARIAIARAFCAAVLDAYWASVCFNERAILPIRTHGLTLPRVRLDAAELAREIGALVATLPLSDAGYLIGSVYTVMLPEAMRSEYGAYYTPPPLVRRLIELAERSGADFARCTVIDPACGGGAFLAPVAVKMLEATTLDAPAAVLADIVARLRGVELDPFAAWTTQVMLEAALLPLCVATGTRLPDVVTVGDALRQSSLGTFDLVIGNPPYGRVKLDDAMRQEYARSLYGHANLYGLFTDLALRLVRPGGVIAYLTPTSFLGGEYFKTLRKLLSDAATPTAFDFVSDRNGVFDNVLQETVLVTYHVARSRKAAAVSLVVPQGSETAVIEAMGRLRVPRDGGPWILPREVKDASYVAVLAERPTRLGDLGYQVSTGQLVWNRHKAQLRETPGRGALPIIWAESISDAGFEYRAARQNHTPYIALDDQPHLVTRRSCVLLQRTTSKEQGRRLLCAVMPQSFVDRHGGVVVENHINMVYAPERPLVRPATIAAILNSPAVDRAFRCISGSVAVSAYEIEALPLPTPRQVRAVERMLDRGAPRSAVNRKIVSFYQEHDA